MSERNCGVGGCTAPDLDGDTYIVNACAEHWLECLKCRRWATDDSDYCEGHQ